MQSFIYTFSSETKKSNKRDNSNNWFTPILRPIIICFISARPTLFSNTTGQIVEGSVKFSKFQLNNKDAFVCHFQRPRSVTKQGKDFEVGTKGNEIYFIYRLYIL